MSDSKNFRDEVRQERKKVKDLKFFQKIAYYWQYYHFRVGMIAVFVLLGVLLAVSVYRNSYERSFYCAIFDGHIEGATKRQDYITTNFTKYLGLDGVKQRVIVDTNYTFKIHGISDKAFYDIENLITRAGGQTVDGYIAEEKYALILNSDEGFFLEDLRNCLTEEELEKLDEYLIYYTFENGEKVPLSIDISSTKFITEAKAPMTKPCYGIVSSSMHKDNAAAFIRYLFDL